MKLETQKDKVKTGGKVSKRKGKTKISDAHFLEGRLS
jgi:hypothetical protein